MGVALCCAAVRTQADVVIVETRSGGQNTSWYHEIAGNWQGSSVKSSAPGTTPSIGSRFSTTDNGEFSVSPVLAIAGGVYSVEVTHATSTYIPTNLMASVTATGGSGLPATTDVFKEKPDHVWRAVGAITLDPGVTTPTITFTKVPLVGDDQRFYADAIRFTWADDPSLKTPQIATVNGPLAAGQTYVDVPTVLSNATAVIVYADGAEIGRRTTGIDGGVERVTTSPLVKGQTIAATQIGTNGIESARLSTGPVVGGGANPRVRISLSIRQATMLTGPIGADGGTTNTPYFFLGASNTFGGGWALAPVGGKVIQPASYWQTVTFERGPNPANPTDPTFAWWGSLGNNELQGNFGVLDAIAFAIDDLSDTGPFRVYIDEIRNGDVLVQGFENAANGQNEVLFQTPGDSGTSFTTSLLAQPPGDFSPDISQVTDEFSYDGNHSALVSWQFLSRAGGNWLRLLATGSGTPNPQLDLRLPISFRILVLPVGVTNPPLQFYEQPQDTSGLQNQPITLEARAIGAKPLTYQWYFQGAPLAGQTNQTLVIPNAQPSDSGDYYAIVTDASGSAPSGHATVFVEPVVSSAAMQPLWRLGPTDRAYLAPDGQQSGLAFNPATSNLILVSRTGGNSLMILNSETGAEVGSLLVDAFILGGYYIINKVAVGPEGAVFVCNMTTNSALTPLRIYYWPAETPGTPSAGPIWEGDPGGGAGGRWGDTLALRTVDVGGTPQWQFLVAARNDNRIAVLRPMSTDVLFTLGDVPAGAFDHGLAWGEGNTAWGKSHQGDLYHIEIDLGNGTASVLQIYTNLPSLAPIGVDPVNNYLAGVSIASPDALRLFGLNNLAAGPTPLDTEYFQTDNAWSASASGAVTFGLDRVYALNPNNGIIALQIPPRLWMTTTNNVMWLRWDGAATLQSAPSAMGTYEDMTGTSSPAPVDMSAQPQQFFRLRK